MKKNHAFFAAKTMFYLMIVSVFFFTALPIPVFAGEDWEGIPTCSYCGMDRHKFSHSRVLVEYDDGTKFGACSIHCAAIDMAVNIDKAPESVMVGDFGSKKLIDAEKAFWVIGGDKMGVMTKRAKWAFEIKEDAEKFVAEHGGTIGDFEAAIEAAYDDMYADTRMIREKRKMKRMKKMQNQG